MVAHRYPWLGGLTSAQRTAATSAATPLAIVAGPGSGKTRTIAARIVDLVERVGVHPSRIVAFTFTRSAAAELKARVVAMGGDDLALVDVTTFHAYATRLLRLDPAAAKLPERFTVARERDAEQAFGSLFEGPLRRPEASRITRTALREALSVFYATARFPEGVAAAMANVYLGRLLDLGLVPFGALEPALLAALDRSDAVRAAARERPTVLVDEAHDASPLEMAIVERLAAFEGGRGLTVVLDPRQAIFGWRGAMGGAVLDRIQANVGAVVVDLAQTFRFGKAVADHAAIVASASGSTLPHVAPAPDLEHGTVHAVLGPRLPYHVAEAVKAYGVGGVAILCRSRRDAELVAAALPEVAETIHGDDREPAWFRIAEALARLVVNPADGVAFRTLYEAEEPYLATRPRFETFAGRTGRARILLDEYAAELYAQKGEAGSLLAWVVDGRRKGAELVTFRDAADAAYAFNVRDKTEPEHADAVVVPYLERLGVLAADVCQAVDAIATAADADAFADVVARGRVPVSTVHAAKGREWDAVFVVTADRWPWGLSSRRDARAAEEWRVYFVAVTRAKREVGIVHGADAPLDEVGLVPEVAP